MSFISRIQRILQAQNIVFALMLIAMATVIIARIPTLFDGSYFLVMSINYQTLLVYSNRWGRALLHVPAMIVAQETGKLEPATLTHCLVFASIPLCVLVLCWLIVRKEKPWLFVWPVVSIVLVSMNMQLACQSENVISCEVMWPLYVGLLTRLTVRKSIMLIGLGLVLVSLHPTNSVVFLSLCTVTSFVLARKREDARLLLIVGSILMVLGALRLAVFYFFMDPVAELPQCSSNTLSRHINKFVDSPPLLISTLFGVLTGFMLLIAKRFPSRTSALLSVVAAIVSSSASIWGAMETMYWAWPFILAAYRFNFVFVLFICLFACLDSLSPAKIDRLRTSLLVFICFQFLVSSSIQSAKVLAMTKTIKRAMKTSKTPVLDSSNYRWEYIKLLGDTNIATLSIILQGKRRPKKIVLPHDLAVEARRSSNIRVTRWTPYPFSNRWFVLPNPVE